MNIRELRELIAEYDRAQIERAKFGQADAPAEVTQAVVDAEKALHDALDELDTDDDSAINFLRLFVDLDRRVETLEATRILQSAERANAPGV